MFGGSSKPKFDANKTKVNLKMLINRFNLLTQKKSNLAKQQKRQVALLLKDDKEPNARILVEHIIREDYTLESYDLLRQYTELLLARLNVLVQEPELKPEIAEAVCALLYAGWLMGSEVPELHTLYMLFTAKYGKPYSEEVVNSKEKYLSHRLLRMLTSTQVPDPTVVELYLTEIAKAYNVEWTPRPQGVPGMMNSSTLGVPLPLPGMPVGTEVPGATPPAQFVPGPVPPMQGHVAGPSSGGLPPMPSFASTTSYLADEKGGAIPFAVALLKSPAGFGMQLDGDNVIVSIKPDSAASQSGALAVGDRVVALNGVEVSRERPVKSVAIDLANGETATFSVVRGRASGYQPPPQPPLQPAVPADPYGLPAQPYVGPVDGTPYLPPQPPPPAAGAPPASTHAATLTKTPLGIGVSLDGDNVVTEVKEDSQAARAGNIQVGDQVVAINGVAPSATNPSAAILQGIAAGTELQLLFVSAAARQQPAAAPPAPYAAIPTGVPAAPPPVVAAQPAPPAAPPAESEDDILARRLEALKRG